MSNSNLYYCGINILFKETIKRLIRAILSGLKFSTGFILVLLIGCVNRLPYVGYQPVTSSQLEQVVNFVYFNKNYDSKLKMFERVTEGNTVLYSLNKFPHYISLKFVEGNDKDSLIYFRYDFHSMSSTYQIRELHSSGLFANKSRSNLNVIYDSARKICFFAIQDSQRSFIILTFYCGEYKEKFHYDL